MRRRFTGAAGGAGVGRLPYSFSEQFEVAARSVFPADERIFEIVSGLGGASFRRSRDVQQLRTQFPAGYRLG